MIPTTSVIKQRAIRRWKWIVFILALLGGLIGGIEWFRQSKIHNGDWGLRFMNYDGYWNLIEVGLIGIGVMVLAVGVVTLVTDRQNMRIASASGEVMDDARRDELIAGYQKQYKRNAQGMESMSLLTFISRRQWTMRILVTFLVAVPLFLVGVELNKKYLHDIFVMMIFGVMAISGLITLVNLVLVLPGDWASYKQKQVKQEELVLAAKDIVGDLSGALSQPSSSSASEGALSQVQEKGSLSTPED